MPRIVVYLELATITFAEVRMIQSTGGASLSMTGYIRDSRPTLGPAIRRWTCNPKVLEPYLPLPMGPVSRGAAGLPKRASVAQDPLSLWLWTRQATLFGLRTASQGSRLLVFEAESLSKEGACCRLI